MQGQATTALGIPSAQDGTQGLSEAEAARRLT